MPIRSLLLAAWLLSMPLALVAPAREPLAPTDGAKRAKQWDKEIAALDASEVPINSVLFVGSSTIRMWDVKSGFSDLPVVNHGFGGSQICDATYFAERLVTKYEPRVIVFYSGDNDTAAGLSPQQVHRDFQEFLATIRKRLPATPIIVFSIKPSVARWALADKMRAANKLIAATCADDKAARFIDVWPTMLTADGKPKPDIFREDGLHMNDRGYEAWNKLLRPILDEYVEPAAILRAKKVTPGS